MRIATISDAEAITALINQAFRVEWFVYSDRIDLDQVRAHFAKGEFLVADKDAADHDATLAGCVYIEARGERSYLGLLSVDPSRQRSGLGAKLMAAAEDRRRENGSRFMDILIVNLREELPAFYRRLGYIEDGTAPFPEGVPTKVPCHFVKMSKPL
ncbi:Acetyltransferase, GNAT family [Candidatus Sulfopaludibacter sp. SbA4]|nr:Acetyltransferase, GNAT family [Candidatus Sulfopaludibacter sp. SbA4]